MTAASIGFFHTLMGPDHYLPFIVMSKANGWSLAKTSWITILCGLGHVLSSVLLGFVGIALGMVVFKLENVEAARGSLAAWLLIIFGFTYFIWGLFRVFRGNGIITITVLGIAVIIMTRFRWPRHMTSPT